MKGYYKVIHSKQLGYLRALKPRFSKEDGGIKFCTAFSPKIDTALPLRGLVRPWVYLWLVKFGCGEGYHFELKKILSVTAHIDASPAAIVQSPKQLEEIDNNTLGETDKTNGNQN